MYLLGLTLFQVWLAPPLDYMPLGADLGWLVLQAAMMLLVGYIIVQLVAIQREQRAALEQAYAQQGVLAQSDLAAITLSNLNQVRADLAHFWG